MKHIFFFFLIFPALVFAQPKITDISLNEFRFGKLRFTTALVVPALGINLSISLEIDSARKSRVKLHDGYMNETNVVTTSISKKDYQRLIQILSAFDFSNLPEEFIFKKQEVTETEKTLWRGPWGIVLHIEEGRPECSNSIFEIQYNDQIKKCKSCAAVPFYYPALEDFLWDYIALKSGQSGKMPRLWKNLFKF
jgi:hypothetical protein